jgi:subtilisin family serine protease
MNRAAILRSSASLLAALCASNAAHAQLTPALPHEFIVRVKVGETIADVADSYGAEVACGLASQRLYLLRTTPAGPSDDATEGALEVDDRLDNVERNYENAVDDGHTQSFFVSAAPSEFLTQPCWPQIGLPWAPIAWEGQDVTIAILDTGVNPHERFASKMLSDGTSFIDSATPMIDAPTGVDTNGNGRFDELAGHGTFLAGLIAETAPRSRILPIRVLDSDGVGSTFATTCGIYYAVEHGARIINVSLGSATPSALLDEAVAAAVRAGSLVVAAAGNGGGNAPDYPAAIPGAIAVASVDEQFILTPWSNLGPSIRFAAPGVDIVSTVGATDYAKASGTSMSTAFVSGTLARVISRMPKETAADTVNALWQKSLPIDVLNPDAAGQVGRAVITTGPWNLPTKPKSTNAPKVVIGPR